MSDRLATGVFSALILGAMSFPVLSSMVSGEPSKDSFPLSDYPMFSYGRHDTAMNITQALGVTKEGIRVPLSPLIASGNREVLQSLMTILRNVQSGRQQSFCKEVARRVTDQGPGEYRSVEIATSRFETVAYFDPESEWYKKPLSRSVHARCPVTP